MSTRGARSFASLLVVACLVVAHVANAAQLDLQTKLAATNKAAEAAAAAHGEELLAVRSELEKVKRACVESESAAAEALAAAVVLEEEEAYDWNNLRNSVGAVALSHRKSVSPKQHVLIRG